MSDAMDRTWEIFPASERIVEDMLRFPVALKRIKDVKGAVVRWRAAEHRSPRGRACVVGRPTTHARPRSCPTGTKEAS
eukprot:COSAG02_NODE_177_length_31154_cov_32.205152_8_plen_78_part_00